jgi:hypothetical protein
MSNIARYAKAVVGFVGMLATYIVATLPPDSAVTKAAAAVLAILTVLGVYAVPNANVPLPPRAEKYYAPDAAPLDRPHPDSF